MATTTRTAQIIIDVDYKSIQELNDEIRSLEKTMKNLKVGTDEFNQANQRLGQLKNKFNEATSEAKKLQNVIQNVSAEQQLKAISKLGTGLVGAFSGIQQAITLLGGGSETLEEIQTKALQFLQLMQSLNAISETFSSTTIKGLGSVLGGFKNLVTAVKGASTAMKTALASTGIGLLVVAVGALVANWEKLINVFSRSGKILEENYKISQQSTKISEEQYKATQKQIELERQKTMMRTTSIDLAELELKSAKAYLDFLLKQSNEIADQFQLIENRRGEYKKMTSEELEFEKQLLREKQNTLTIDIQLAKLLKDRADTNLLIAGSVYEIEEKTKELENDLIVINSKEYESQKIYEKQREILVNQLKIIGEKLNIEGDITEEEKDQVNRLDAQIKALDEQEKIRIRLLENQKQNLNFLRESQMIQRDIVEKYNSIYTALELERGIIQTTLLKQEDKVKALEEQKKIYEDLLEKQYNISNFDKIGFEMFKEQNAELLKQLDSMSDLFNESKNILKTQLEGKNINEKILEIHARELSFFKQSKELELSKFNIQKQSLLNSQELLQAQKLEIQDRNTIILKNKEFAEAKKIEAELNLKNAKNEEARIVYIEEIVGIEGEINGYIEEIYSNKLEIAKLDSEILSTETKISQINNNIKKTTEDVSRETENITNEIEKQSRAYRKLQDFFGDYYDEIISTRDLIIQSFELIATIQESRAMEIEQRINVLNNELEIAREEESRFNDERLKFEELLKDANGERYEELLDAIDEASRKERDAFNEKMSYEAQLAKEQEKKKEAELKAARWRKAQAIIDATIQTAISVVEALPNLILAGIVGALGAAQIATIAAQKPAVYSEGGFTKRTKSDKDAVGIVHANEYVVPAKVVKSPLAQSHIEALERQRVKGYENGGFVAPAGIANYDNNMDYEKFASILVNAISVLPPSQVSLVAVSNGLREIDITKQSAGLNRGK
jgi:hypothetical protein